MGSFWFNLILVVQIIVGVAIIVFVLLQHGKGADMGAAFGGGSAGSLFGSSGSANFLSRTTAVLAAIFFVATLSLSYLASHVQANEPRGVMDNFSDQSVPVAAPAAQKNKAADTTTKDTTKPQDIPK